MTTINRVEGSPRLVEKHLAVDILVGGVLRSAGLISIFMENWRGLAVLLALHAAVRTVGLFWTSPEDRRPRVFLGVAVAWLVAAVFYNVPSPPALLVAGVFIQSLLLALVGLSLAVGLSRDADHPLASRVK